MAQQPLKSNRFEFLFGIITTIFVIAFWMMWGPSENAPVTAIEEDLVEVELNSGIRIDAETGLVRFPASMLLWEDARFNGDACIQPAGNHRWKLVNCPEE